MATSFIRRTSLSSRLILAFCTLILITTLSAGVPAYWLIGTELQQQAQAHVLNVQQATVALIGAEQNRLFDLVTLLAERPTLHTLLQTEKTAELDTYLQVFRRGIELDAIVVCDLAGQPIAGDTDTVPCATPAATPTEGLQIIQGQPAMIVNQRIADGTTAELLGSVTAVIWLDSSFTQKLAQETGLEQSIVLPTGQRIASTLAEGSNVTFPQTPQMTDVMIGNGRYYTALSALTDTSQQIVAYSEVALPIGDVITAQNRALFVLAVSTGIVAILGSALGGWYAYRLTAPLQQLTNAASQISQGDLTTPVPALRDPQEIATLATALEESRTNILHNLDELGRARDWLNNLVQSVVEGVVTFDTYGRITFFSQGAEIITGWGADQAIGQSINDIFRVADSGGLFLDRIPPRGGKVQINILTRPGKNITLAVSGSRLIPPHDNKVQIALVLRDVTEEEASQRLRAYFLANISHEFRTPLTALNASIELLLNETEPLSAEEMRHLLKPTYLSLLGLQTLIDNLLESSSIEAGRFTIRCRPTDFGRVTADAVRMVSPLLDRRQQQLVLHEPTESTTLLADPPRLLQVLVNLLSNASKYSPAGSQIEVTVTETAEFLHVAVADQGPGIPPTDRDSVFVRFVRVGPQSGEQYGIGLGLYVAKSIVEGHNGRVGIADRPGGGTVFWFEIPNITDDK